MLEIKSKLKYIYEFLAVHLSSIIIVDKYSHSVTAKWKIYKNYYMDKKNMQIMCEIIFK